MLEERSLFSNIGGNVLEHWFVLSDVPIVSTHEVFQMVYRIFD